MHRMLPYVVLACGLASVPARATSPAGAPSPVCELKDRAARLGGADASPAERHEALLKSCASDEVVALTKHLVSFATVSSEAPPAKSPAFAQMARFLSRWAKEHGFSFQSVDRHAVFEVSWGKGAPVLGFVLHGDVVPAPRHEWSRPPFEAVVENGKLIGRGVEDDKGPLAATLVAMAMAKEAGLSPKGRVVVIIGNGEESDWEPMKTYVARAPKPRHVVSIDSAYPVVAAQSGFVAWALESKMGPAEDTPGALATAVDVSSGEFLTQVPGLATLTLAPHAGVELERLEAQARQAISELKKIRQRLKAEVERGESSVIVKVHGRAVHSSGAEEGHNALWDLSALATRLPLTPNGISRMLRAVERRFDQDHWGTKLGLAYADPLMGKLLVAPTVLRVEGDTVKLSINMRRPRGKDKEAFRAMLSAAARVLASDSDGHVREADAFIGDPHVADTSGPLVETLLRIYHAHTGGSKAAPIAIRGGTYARLFPGAVDFGPSLPGEPYTGHAPDESISIEALQRVAEMTGAALRAIAVEGLQKASREGAPGVGALATSDPDDKR